MSERIRPITSDARVAPWVVRSAAARASTRSGLSRAEPRHAGVGIGHDRGQRLIYFVSDGCRELADCSDSNHASKFGTRYLQSLFGAPLFRHLREKRIVCALQFERCVLQPVLPAHLGIAEGTLLFAFATKLYDSRLVHRQ